MRAPRRESRIARRLRRLRVTGKCDGFTLVELVIALALIGLISLLLFAGLRLGTRVWEGVESTAERIADPRLARNFLMRTLSQTRPTRVVFDAENVLVFRGDTENLEFVAPLSEHVGIPGMYVLRLTLESAEVRRLVLTRWLLHPDVLQGFAGIPEWAPFDTGFDRIDSRSSNEDLAAGAFGRTLLLDAVEELEISYFGVAQGDEDPQWYPEWLEEPKMPLALRMHLTTRNQRWPDLFIGLPQGHKALAFSSVGP